MATSWDINRGWVPSDTATIDDGASIVSGVLYLYPTAKSDTDPTLNTAYGWIVLVDADKPNTASTALVGDDYNNSGTTECSDRKEIADIALNQYLGFTLNASGLALISKTGTTKLGLKEGHDVLNSALVKSGFYGDNSVTFSSSEATGTNQDPYLELTIQASGPANIKTYQGLDKASAKNINSLAVGSNKSWNGLQ